MEHLVKLTIYLVDKGTLAGEEVREGLVGVVSIRHPENPNHFLMSRARAPEVLDEGDILEMTLEGVVVASIQKKGAGTFTLPGLLKITAFHGLHDLFIAHQVYTFCQVSGWLQERD